MTENNVKKLQSFDLGQRSIALYQTRTAAEKGYLLVSNGEPLYTYPEKAFCDALRDYNQAIDIALVMAQEKA